MSGNFDNLNAPQFYDFNKDFNEDQNADSYFETDHELREPQEDPLKFRSPEQDNNEITLTNNSDYDENNSRKLRRSLSVGNLLNDVNDGIVDNIKDGTLTSEVNKHTAVYSSCNDLSEANDNNSLNERKMYLPLVLARAQRLSKAVSKEHLNRLAQPKKYVSDQNLNKYVSVAEAVRKFHSGTPTRFRTRPTMSKLKITVPQMPALLSTNRNRPVAAISIEERERLEYEEAQKFKIKSKPLNKKILQGPIPLVPIERKPATIVKPFNITEVPQKPVIFPKEEGFKFCAKPVPKCVFESPKLKVLQKTKSLDQYVKGPVRPSRKNEEEAKPNVKLTTTIPKPFSFEERDRRMFKKKEEFVKNFIEEEKRAAEFHARPIPKAILRSAKSNSSLKRSDSSDINGELTKSEENISTQFRARPATILKKKPFIPRKEERQLIEISEFQLNTERRVKEREEFEQSKKEKEERLALIQQREEEIRLQREKEEIDRLRKDLEYKAKPIKKYKEIIIQPSGKVTKPISPTFHTSSKNKENLP
ncbi:targeting protein for Xklp2 homolog [Anoplophora glabripennis]|uniref:targeting protein for Xklp2 homolog n=1 Tax=Anoplophora glabripennis TaxID=217634 RepID=UPI00087542D3|nr:targeting protein for Xklp2 homolog [Anoplophora glabripennis]